MFLMQGPQTCQNFRASPEVEMMFIRYKMYREGRESLLGMALLVPHGDGVCSWWQIMKLLINIG